ncbi:MAG: hypothetical protein HOA75_17285 [Deltaproteobacteria bacterium]|nr:hypothetical protein [Deltaproteobacteria bacterium]
MIPGNPLSKETSILFVLLWSTGFIGAKLGWLAIGDACSANWGRNGYSTTPELIKAS